MIYEFVIVGSLLVAFLASLLAGSPDELFGADRERDTPSYPLE